MIKMVWKGDKGESCSTLANNFQEVADILLIWNDFSLPFADDVLLREVHLIPYNEELGEKENLV